MELVEVGFWGEGQGPTATYNLLPHPPPNPHMGAGEGGAEGPDFSGLNIKP